MADNPYSPNGTIKVLRRVPLDNTYTNSIRFSSPSEQYNYFNDDRMVKFTFYPNTYTRLTRNTLRIEHNAEDLLDCNYLMFQNSPFASIPDTGISNAQWYYAFISEIKYLNVYTSEITFEIDVLQTFQWLYNLDQCFVEREHTLTDVVGEWTLPEPYPTGQIVMRNLLPIFDTDKRTAVISATKDSETGLSYNTMTNGIVSATNYTSFPYDTSNYESCIEDMKEFVDKYINFFGSEDDILSIQVLPTSMFNIPSDSYLNATPFPYSLVVEKTKTIGGSSVAFDRPDNISGYVPKNNKLLCYPYNFFCISCGGNARAYKYEYFSDPSNIRFILFSVVSAKSIASLTPVDYLSNIVNTETSSGTSANYSLNYNEELVLDNFPQISFAGDSFKSWLYNNLKPTLATAASSMASYGVGSALSGLTQGAMYTGGVALGKDTNGIDYSVAKNPYSSNATVATGQAINETAEQGFNVNVHSRGDNIGTLDLARNTQNFFFSKMEARQEVLKMIDGLFTMYGYLVNQIKVPNCNLSVDNWTRKFYYCKCSMVNCKWYLDTNGSSVPMEYMKKIVSIYNSGVTFWLPTVNVGDYSIDNSPS